MKKKESDMPISTLLLLIIILLIVSALPAWPYSRNWGYYPSSGLGTLLIVVIILILLGWI